MEVFKLHHPRDVTVLCDRNGFEQVADYLEVDDHGQEYRVCASSQQDIRFGCRCGNQVLICRFAADLPLEPERLPLHMTIGGECWQDPD